MTTLTTDFGDQFASSQLIAVIAGLGYDKHIVENHSVSPFAISEGAFEIQQLAKFSPDDSVHLGVIDPGVGTERWGVVIKTKRSWLVGPNNGLLYPTAESEGIEQVWKIQEKAFGNNVANTFHGRDVFVKATVYLAQGKNPEDFGCVLIQENDLEKLSFSTGEVIHVDAYGNYKIIWSQDLIVGKKLKIQSSTDKSFIVPIVKTFDDVKTDQPLALLGSHGTLELALNLSNAAEFYKFQVGERLMIEQV